MTPEIPAIGDQQTGEAKIDEPAIRRPRDWKVVRAARNHERVFGDAPRRPYFDPEDPDRPDPVG